MTTDQRPSRLSPRFVLAWGIALTVGGVALELLLPTVGAALVSSTPSAPLDQGLLLLLDLVVRVVKLSITPVGAALVGAAVVMSFVAPLVTRSANTPDADQSTPES